MVLYCHLLVRRRKDMLKSDIKIRKIMASVDLIKCLMKIVLHNTSVTSHKFKSGLIIWFSGIIKV